jgi:hypothetical protein
LLIPYPTTRWYTVQQRRATSDNFYTIHSIRQRPWRKDLIQFLWSEVLASVSNKMTAFWAVTHDRMETVGISETLLSIYHNTRRGKSQKTVIFIVILFFYFWFLSHQN